MSQETIQWLNTHTLCGFTAVRGDAWHRRAGSDNHFEGPVPPKRVHELFGWQPLLIPHTYPFKGQERTSDRVDLVHGKTGDLLGVFKEGYQLHRYPEWLVRNVETMLDDGLAIGSAGELKKGALAWVQVELPENVEVPNTDTKFRPSLLACTSMDGSVATSYRESITNVVCDNTLGTALGERGRRVVKFKHTRNSAGKFKVLTAREALGIVFQMTDEISAGIQSLVDTRVTDKQWKQFLDEHMGERPADKGRSQTIYDNKRDKLRTMWRTDKRVSPWKGTAWGVVQAVNTYVQHEQTVRNTVPALRNYEKAIKGDFDVLDATTLKQLAEVGVK